MKQHAGLPCVRAKKPQEPPASLCARYLRHSLNPAAVAERDRWIEDHLIPRADAAVDFDPRAKIAPRVHFAELCLAIFDNGHLHSVAVEYDRIGRHQKA